MLIEKKISEILPEIPGTSFDFKGTYTDADGNIYNVTVFDTEYFILNVNNLCRNRRIFVDETTPTTYLITLFQAWKTSREELYLKQAYAYKLRYNPIENYSSREVLQNDETIHSKGSVNTRTYTNFTEKDDFHNSDTITDTNTIITSPADTTTDEKMAFNSSQYSGDTKTTRGGSITEEHNPGEDPGNIQTDHTGYVDHTTTGSYADTGSGRDVDTRNYTLTKKGNIGVQTASEMLAKEFEGLKQDLAFRAFSEFIDRYTYYTESIEGWW